MRRNAKIELLVRTPLFAGCSKEQLAEITKITDEIDIPAGKVMIREGKQGRQFFVVLAGSVKVTKNGRALPVRGGREYFGEIALLSDAPTTATVIATSPVRALVITRQDFRALMKRMPTIQHRLLRVLADRLAADAL